MPPSSNEPSSQTRAFSYKTHWSVHVTNAIAKWVITIGGIGTIFAVSLVGVFLVWVAAPLFFAPEKELLNETPPPWPAQDTQLIHLSMDEFQLTGWALTDDGTVTVMRLDRGEALQQLRLPGADRLTDVSMFEDGQTAVLAYDDGSYRYGQMGIQTEFRQADEVAEEARQLAVGESMQVGEGMLVRLSEALFRHHRFGYDFADPVRLETQTAIHNIDHAEQSSRVNIGVLDEEGRLYQNFLTRRENFMTGEVTYRHTQNQIKYQLPEGRDLPKWLKMNDQGSSIFLIWEDGFTQVLDLIDLSQPSLRQTLDMAEEEGAVINVVDFLIGGNTLITGDSQGRVRAWFEVNMQQENSADTQRRLVNGHEMATGETPVTHLSPSQRSRVVAAGYEGGAIRLFHVTSDQQIFSSQMPGGEEIAYILMAEKEDGLLTASPNNVARWALDLKHPEVTLAAIFSPVWYEGYAEPAYVWQTTGGSDAFEPKYSLAPLIFGTIKGTVYSMLFALPLALLAAIYTSEFMRPRLKSVVKPTIELMASLPSVVIGFLGALIIAPYVQKVLPAVLLLVFLVPLMFFLGAAIWQVLPRGVYFFCQRFHLAFVLLAMALGVWLSYTIGPAVERWLFDGSIMVWLNQRAGSAWPGWFLLLLPLSGIAVVLLFLRWVNPALQPYILAWGREQQALLESGKIVAGLLLTAVIAALLASLASLLGLDVRGGFVDTYMQRNAFVVGFVMGFAVIPIIYTISDDALSCVPSHLRSASLGCGATPWQTALYIVIPTAMSGLFSAIMIGLGRAVGETMIVLMAAGNTPVLDWNIFNGFRTLSATLAVELPEAVRNSTHYRMLFLAALTLFVMTFILNTVAEIVRLRFRRRTYEL